MPVEEETSPTTDIKQSSEPAEQSDPKGKEESLPATGDEIADSEDTKLANQTTSGVSIDDGPDRQANPGTEEEAVLAAALKDKESGNAEPTDALQAQRTAEAEPTPPASSNIELNIEKAEEPPSDPKSEGGDEAIIEPSSPSPPAPIPKSPVVPAPQVPSKDGNQEAGTPSALDAGGRSMEAQGSSSGKSDAVSSYEVVAQAFGKRVGTPSQSGSRSGSPAPRPPSSLSQQKEGLVSEKPEQRIQEVSQTPGREPPRRKQSIPTNQAAEEASFDFNRFLEQMKHRSAAPVGEYVRR